MNSGVVPDLFEWSESGGERFLWKEELSKESHGVRVEKGSILAVV